MRRHTSHAPSPSARGARWRCADVSPPACRPLHSFRRKAMVLLSVYLAGAQQAAAQPTPTPSASTSPSVTASPSLTRTPTSTPTATLLCSLEDFDASYVGASNGLPLPIGWVATPAANVRIFSSRATLDQYPGAVSLTPFYGSKFAYVLSGSANSPTNLSSVINVPSAGALLSAYVWYDTYETLTGLDFASFSVVALASPSAATGTSTTVYSIVASQVALGTDSGGDTVHGGQTGWVQVTYTFPAAGYYRLIFSVTNVPDSFYNSAFAVDHIQVGAAL